MNICLRVICFTILLLAFSFHVSAEDFTNAIHAYLQQRIEVEKRDVGIVVGIVDEKGSNIISCGKLDNGTDQKVNEDTIFELGSITKTFTALLLQDMVERGQMNLDDPVAKYLPKSVKVPAYNGVQITLRQLVDFTSGLPTTSITWIPKRADNPRAEYTVKKMYDFLSDYKLTRSPGTKYEYSTVATALLGQAVSLKASANYESLVVNRICRPLKMDSTKITLTGEMKKRFAAGHAFGYVVPPSYWGALAPSGGFRSTANDLLKYVSANLGLTASSLTPAMEKTQIAQFNEDDNNVDIALVWDITHRPDGTKIISEGGLTEGFISFICFDKTRRRGIVVLCNSQDFDICGFGMLLLESQWQTEKRPQEAKISNEILDSFVGQYRPRSTNGQPAVGIYRRGDNLFAQISLKMITMGVLLPPITGQLQPQSKDCLFDRVCGIPITFSRNAAGKITGFTVDCFGNTFSYDKISDQLPKIPEPPKPHITVKLDKKILDAIVGEYEFAPDASHSTGIKLKIWRQGNQLTGQAFGENLVQGAFDIFPESQTDFFIKVDGSQLTFLKNDKGQITSVIRRQPKLPDCQGKKIK